MISNVRKSLLLTSNKVLLMTQGDKRDKEIVNSRIMTAFSVTVLIAPTHEHEVLTYDRNRNTV